MNIFYNSEYDSLDVVAKNHTGWLYDEVADNVFKGIDAETEKIVLGAKIFDFSKRTKEELEPLIPEINWDEVYKSFKEVQNDR